MSSADKKLPQVSLIVPRRLVKSVKSRLEKQKQYDRRAKIGPRTSFPESLGCEFFIVPTLIKTEQAELGEDYLGRLVHYPRLAQVTGLTGYSQDIWIEFTGESSEQQSASPRQLSLPGTPHFKATNDLSKVIGKWISALPGEILRILWPSNDPQYALPPSGTPRLSYTLYPPMLLICSTFLSTIPLHNLPQTHMKYQETLFVNICEFFKVSHLALKGTIPDSDGNLRCKDLQSGSDANTSNVFRSPAQLIKLYGDFGPELPTLQHPEDHDIQQAFWCSAHQNGVAQVWAPRYTMFSQGNISEKMRLLRLRTLNEETLGCTPDRTSAVDLYAGIGYFAFSYAKAGVGKVLCWEINPWSVEGLKRGAKANKWEYQENPCARGSPRKDIQDGKFLIFGQSNAQASDQVRELRNFIPPIRHVNCGYLPKSDSSWKTAVDCLDPEAGGWVHAHENVANAKIEMRATEVVEIFKSLTSALWDDKAGSARVYCEHVERVKSYAPKVTHCVFDITILPSSADS